MKVLIIDGDWSFAEQVRDSLEAKANLVVTESHAKAALEQARRWQPDLVIVAAETAAREGFLDSLSSVSPRPAVLLTERMDRFDRAWRAWQKGGDELLLKPVLCGDDLDGAIIAARENAVSGRARTRKAVRAAS
ncbi:MAG: hypothetical protein WC869_09235 [Phycisphaerae bacterium]|jgi:DNA-binding response OmpR family regulator